MQRAFSESNNMQHVDHYREVIYGWLKLYCNALLNHGHNM